MQDLAASDAAYYHSKIADAASSITVDQLRELQKE
jgi:hypothetical protein